MARRAPQLLVRVCDPLLPGKNSDNDLNSHSSKAGSKARIHRACDPHGARNIFCVRYTSDPTGVENAANRSTPFALRSMIPPGAGSASFLARPRRGRRGCQLKRFPVTTVCNSSIEQRCPIFLKLRTRHDPPLGGRALLMLLRQFVAHGHLMRTTGVSRQA